MRGGFGTLSSLLERLEAVGRSLPPEVRERGFNRNYAKYHLRLRLLAPHLERPRRVLDVGAGAAVVGRALSRAGHRVAAVDTWAEYAPERENQMGERSTMLAQLREEGVRPVQGDLLRGGLPFADDAFHVATLFDVIEHFPASPAPVLREIRRVLRPGGILVLSTPNVANLRARLRLLAGKTVHPPIEEWFSEGPFFGHHREFTAGEVGWMLEAAGFRLRRRQLSNAPQWNTRRGDGTWGRGYRPSSPHQVAKGVYFALTALWPRWRYGIYAVAEAPGEAPDPGPRGAA